MYACKKRSRNSFCDFPGEVFQSVYTTGEAWYKPRKTRRKSKMCFGGYSIIGLIISVVAKP